MKRADDSDEPFRPHRLPPSSPTGARPEAAAGGHRAVRARALPGEAPLFAVAAQRAQLLRGQPGE